MHRIREREHSARPVAELGDAPPGFDSLPAPGSFPFHTLLGEHLTPTMAVAALLIFTGIALALVRR